MKETIEQAAKEYADGLRSVDKKSTYDNIDVDSARMVAFKRGAEWQAKQSPWISVEERLPDVGISVFVRTTNKKYVLTSMYIPTDCKGNILGPKEWHGSGAFKGSITHWMPIPE